MSECHNNSPYKAPEGFLFFFHDSDIFVFKITKRKKKTPQKLKTVSHSVAVRRVHDQN